MHCKCFALFAHCAILGKLSPPSFYSHFLQISLSLVFPRRRLFPLSTEGSQQAQSTPGKVDAALPAATYEQSGASDRSDEQFGVLEHHQ